MKSLENTRRELFEAWYKNEFPSSELSVQNLIGTYTKTHVDLCWQAFNAALDSVVIEVPPYHELHEMTSGDLYDAVLVSIKSTNLGIKVK